MNAVKNISGTLNRVKFFVIAIIVLWLIGTVASYAASVPSESEWIPVAFQAVAYITTVAIISLALWALWLVFNPIIASLFAESKPEPESEPDEAPAITRTLADLATILADAEQDSNRAGVLLADATTYAAHLVRLVQAIALKADDMLAEVDGLQQALAAIASQDVLEIARAAGQVNDEHIRSLMLCRVRDDGYWQDTAFLINTQLGTLTRWAKGYRLFSSRLLADVAAAKAQLASAQAALELTGASRPLLQIQHSLNEASYCLQLEHRPGLGKAARLLPTVNAGLIGR